MADRGGRFITLEGGEGAGKSTQIRLLAEHLRMRGIDVVVTREPGGSTGAELIRKLLVEGPADSWDGPTEALLMFAARRDHLVRTVWPALDHGQWVISDRFADSTRAYQGYGHGVDLPLIETLYRVAVGDFRPDLTLILDLPVETGLARAGRRHGNETRFEQLDVAFHRRVRDGFRQIAAAEPARCVIVDADAPVEGVQARLAEIVAQRLGVG
ncbi:MAG: dTMP kinase [Alphaproteobacteria bacterium]|nr:dTMP kinase [Alphaproteobacteria bacterium]